MCCLDFTLKVLLLISKLKITIVLLFFAFISQSILAQNKLEKNKYPIFKELNPKSQVIGMFYLYKKYQLLEIKPDYILKQPASIARHSGIRYCRDCYLIRQGGKQGWVIDGITVEGQVLKTDFKCNQDLFPVLCLSFTISLISIIILLIKYFKQRDWKSFYSGRSTLSMIVISLLLLRCTSILAVLFRAGKFIIETNDVEGYFKTGQVIFKTFDFSQCRYTIGHSFFVGLFSLICNADTWQDMVLPFSYFNSFFIGSCTGLLIFYLGYFLFKSKTAGIVSLVIYVLYPFLLQVNHTGEIYSRDFLYTPIVFEYSLRLVYWTTIVGFTALSDFTNQFYILGIMVLSLWLTRNNDYVKSKKRIVVPLLIGVLFGFSGAIRPSNIYFLLCFLYILLHPFFTLEKIQFRHIVNALFLFCIGMVIGFFPQIIANYLQDGNILTMPYHNHLYHSAQVEKGFELSFFPIGAKMLFNGSSILLSISVCALFLSPARIRVFAVLFVAPLIFFYCGYYGSSHVIRFILPVFPGLMILAQQAFRKSPYAVFTALILFFIFKSQYRVSSDMEIRYILSIFICSVIISCIAYYVFDRSKRITYCKRMIIDFLIIVFIQIVVIASGFPKFGYLGIVYFLFLAISMFGKETEQNRLSINNL